MNRDSDRHVSDETTGADSHHRDNVTQGMQRGEAEGKRNVKNVKTGASAQCERWETKWEKQRKASMCDDIETLCEELANEKVKLVAISQAGDNGHKNI